MADKYYFVVSTHHEKKKRRINPHVSNSILKNIHPVTWAANPPAIFDKYMIITLHFWEEISETVAIDANKSGWIGIEDNTTREGEG